MQSLSAPSSTADASLLPQSAADAELALSSDSNKLYSETAPEVILTESTLMQPIDAAAEPANESSWQQNLQVFTSTFLTIFLAELGDKTQVTTLLMAAESHSPWIVFAGAGAALIATSAIGCWLGCWLAKRVSPRLLERSVGVLLLVVAALLVCDVIQG